MAQQRLPFKKIYIDSKYATPDSKSTSRFRVQLPQTCQLPDDCVFYITDVCIPHSWKTIEEGVNDTLYMVRINRDVSSLVTIEGIIIRLAENNYTPTTFAEELQIRLREYTGSESFFVTVDSDSSNSGITIQNAAVN